MTTIPTPYYGGGQVPNPADVIPTSGTPSNKLIQYRLGTLAVDNSEKTIYGLASLEGGVADWIVLGGESVGAFPITPYVVGPHGHADYQTVQDGINAAHAAGGGMVYVQPGTYTENLTLYSGIEIWGAGAQSSTIEGTHTPPTSGSIGFFRVNLAAPVNAISSMAAGTTTMFFDDCSFNIDNGYSINIPNWQEPGFIGINACFVIGGNDGLVDMSAGTGSIQISANSSFYGNSNPLLAGGTIGISGGDLGGPITFTLESSFGIISGCSIGGTVSSSGSCSIYNCSISPVAGAAAIDISSGGFATVSGCSLNTSGTYSIMGTGTLTLIDTALLGTTALDPHLILQGSSQGNLTSAVDLVMPSPGNKIHIASGTNASVGTSSAMSSGSVTVNTTVVTANSLIFLTPHTLGTVSAPQALYVSARTPGTSFTITSASNTDTSTVDWWIIN